MTEFIRIPYTELKSTLEQILLWHSFPATEAAVCAEVFALNTLEGVYSHGVNRFVKFVEYVKGGHVRADSRAVMKHGTGAIEQWDGQSGPGPVNAYIAADRAMELARQYGMGCVALANTNHWLRGGTYAWKAVRAGFAYIAWSNTIANMPPWGAVEKKLGNNPVIVGVPFINGENGLKGLKGVKGGNGVGKGVKGENGGNGGNGGNGLKGEDGGKGLEGLEEAVVLDMALSQYSFGALEIRRQKNEQLPLPGGYDKQGNLTTDPAAIMESWRPLPIGYWKGAGLSLLLDMLATILSGGLSTSAVTAQGAERNLSQVFITVDLTKLHNYTAMGDAIRNIIADYASATPAKEGDTIRYPGESVVATRRENLEKGIPVLRSTWEKVVGMVGKD